jgi:hypothetical protein
LTPSADPAVAGFVASLEHPGGNITGIAEMMPELTPQWLGMLKQIVPALSRAAILWRPGTLSDAMIEKVKEARPDGADIRLQLVAANGPADFDVGFAAMKQEGAEARIGCAWGKTLSAAPRSRPSMPHSRWSGRCPSRPAYHCLGRRSPEWALRMAARSPRSIRRPHLDVGAAPEDYGRCRRTGATIHRTVLRAAYTALFTAREVRSGSPQADRSSSRERPESAQPRRWRPCRRRAGIHP